MKTFEDYMQEIHMELHPMTLDDDLPDAYSDWLGTLDGEDYMRFGEIAVLKAHTNGMSKAKEILLPEIK
jgi:hypothetical protein